MKNLKTFKHLKDSFLSRVFKHSFRHLNPRTHIMKKIWLSTATISLSSLLLIGIIAQLFFSRFILRSAITRAQNNHFYTANALDDTISHLTNRFVEICGTKDFRDILIFLKDADSSHYTQFNNALQETLHNLSVSSPLLDSAVITTRNGSLYHPFSHSTKDTVYNYTLGYPENEIFGITLLPRISSPLKYNNEVIPLAFPLKYEARGNYTAVCRDVADSDAILFLLFNADAFNDYLSAYSNSDTQGTLYVMTDTGTLINPATSAMRVAKDEIDNTVVTEITNLTDTKTSGQIHKHDRYIFYQKLSSGNFYLINSVSVQHLTHSMVTIRLFLSIVAIASVIVVTLVTRISASYISKPLSSLMGAVQAIENNTYTSNQMLTQEDEIGQLSAALDSMYHTIQEQIAQIKAERKAKYNTKIRLLAEQINPHFLYNTLEYINMEVYNGHTQNASRMIQSLGEFLRIGLNLGNDQIPLSREIDHVRAYLTIMDHRLDHSIAFTSQIDPALLNFPVPKIILQPLVENSIRHGFLLESNGSYIAFPSISITARKENDLIFLCVTDNGIGIDTQKAQQITHMGLDEEGQHIGLNNVCQRLQLYYGPRADITFTSIPYYQNTVQIQIPCTDATDNKEAFLT